VGSKPLIGLASYKTINYKVCDIHFLTVKIKWQLNINVMSCHTMHAKEGPFICLAFDPLLNIKSQSNSYTMIYEWYLSSNIIYCM